MLPYAYFQPSELPGSGPPSSLAGIHDSHLLFLLIPSCFIAQSKFQRLEPGIITDTDGKQSAHGIGNIHVTQ